MIIANAVFNSLLDSGNFSDASVVCRDILWKVHKTILCPRSEWFRQAFAGADAVRGIPFRLQRLFKTVECIAGLAKSFFGVTMK